MVGVNSAPVVDPDSGTVDEDFTGTITDTLTFSDTDDDPSDLTVTTVSNQPGDNGFGIFNVDASGNWSYDLAETDPVVQALLPGETLTDTVTVTVSDDDGATDTDVITITITGANDAPIVSVDLNGDNPPNNGVILPPVPLPSNASILAAPEGVQTWEQTSNVFTDADGNQAIFTVTSDQAFSYNWGGLAVTTLRVSR